MDENQFKDRLRQEALLKEYEMCQQEATSTANWIWTSTTVFLFGWITALGLVAANIDKFKGLVQLVWILAGAASFAQVVWMVFIQRSLHVRQLMFLRQRQIESKTGMLKGLSIEASDRLDRQTRRKNLEPLFEHVPEKLHVELADYISRSQQIENTPFESFLRFVWKLFRCFLGLGGRGTLYLLSLSVAFAWLAFAFWIQFGR